LDFRRLACRRPSWDGNRQWFGEKTDYLPDMPLPNFLIIGAPKAGSTSLYYYVSQHPEVFTSKVKEPGFFRTYKKEGRFESLESYMELFQGSEAFKAVGEGSPQYLSDIDAPVRIKQLLPGAKLIAILRDPYQRAFSQYVFLRMRGQEPESDFIGAVEADLIRSPDERTNYVGQSLYHESVTRYLAHFAPRQMKIVLLEDMESDPDAVMSDVFTFLGVDPNIKVDTSEKLTPSGVPRIRFLDWFLSSRNPIKTVSADVLPMTAKKLFRRARSANLKRQSISDRERRRLAPYFENDVARLERLLGRDLSLWKSDGSRRGTSH
jgi:hypothetical protein